MGKTIHQLLAEATQRLREKGIASPRLDAEVILSHQLGIERIDLIIKANTLLNSVEEERYKKKIEERVQGRPTQYITGHQEFMGLDFKVNSKVLIPRPDTEILVEEAMKEAKAMKNPLTILEIGTGSGAIALSLAHFIKGSYIHTVDISPEASHLAQENAKSLHLDQKVSFYIGDLFELIPKDFIDKVDLLVSNPPYIPKEEIKKLQREVKEYEPLLALDGGEDGLDFYRRIIKEGKEFLSLQGKMILEVGHDQGARVARLMEEEDFFDKIELKKDLAGINRVVLGERRKVH